MAVDEAGEDGEAGGVDRFGIARRLGLGTAAGVRDAAVVNDDHGVARGLSGGRVEERVRVHSANHEAILVVDQGLAEGAELVQLGVGSKGRALRWFLAPGAVGPVDRHVPHPAPAVGHNHRQP